MRTLSRASADKKMSDQVEQLTAIPEGPAINVTGPSPGYDISASIILLQALVIPVADPGSDHDTCTAHETSSFNTPISKASLELVGIFRFGGRLVALPLQVWKSGEPERKAK